MFFGKKFTGHHRNQFSGLDILVLSIIKKNEGISGYEIMQKINGKFKNVWKVSPGTIYPMLNKLEQKELIEGEETLVNNRPTKKFHISTKGIKTLESSLEHNLEPSINSLKGFLKTIADAIPRFSCFPFTDLPTNCMCIPEEGQEIRKYEDVKDILKKLNATRSSLAERIKQIDKRIERYEELVEELKPEEIIIPIVDEEEFNKDFEDASEENDHKGASK